MKNYLVEDLFHFSNISVGTKQKSKEIRKIKDFQNITPNTKKEKKNIFIYTDDIPRTVPYPGQDWSFL